MQTELAKRYILPLAGVSILLLAFRSASVRVVARADSPKPVSLAIHRQHAGSDCTSGQILRRSCGELFSEGL
jgi:hypothetical protein